MTTSPRKSAALRLRHALARAGATEEAVIRAWNRLASPAFDAVVKALEAMLECSPCRNGCDSGDMTCATNKARAALALAKGREQVKIGPYEVGTISSRVLCAPSIGQRTPMKHEEKRMPLVQKWPKKHTGQTGRRWNVWHGVYKCPDCGAEKHSLTNPMRGNSYFCDGDNVRRAKYAAAMLAEKGKQP